MNNYQEVLDNIITEWAKDVPNGQPDKTNPYHLVILEQSMNNLNLPDWFNKKWLLSEIRGGKQVILEKKGDTSATTFYHEFITGAIVGGWSPGTINTGADLIPALKFCQATTGQATKGVGKNINDKVYVDKKGISFFDKSKKPNSKIVSDAKSTATEIIKKIGKTKGLCLWTGPTNDNSPYGAADIAGNFGSKYGKVGVSLKYGAGQLKNLTIGTFMKALGLGQMTGDTFVKNYTDSFDYMTKDWMTLVTKLFNSKISGKNKQKAKDIFNKHSQKTWSAYQSEKITDAEYDILIDALGWPLQKKKESKHRTFRYFCRKMQEEYMGRKWGDWIRVRIEGFKDVFGHFLKENEKKIYDGLHDLFKRQLSVGKTSMFYAAKAGKTFWFIPSETLYNKTFNEKEFTMDYHINTSASDFEFVLQVGTVSGGPVGEITVVIRFAKGQMEGVPDAKSKYKLVADDWADLLGKFRK